jgi:transposase
MEPLPESVHPGWPLPCVPPDWEHTPAAVQAYGHTLQDELTQLRARVEALEARLTQHATTSHRPPSSDWPSKKPRQRPATTSRKAGGKPGHPGQRQALVPPTTVHALRPERCPCGNTTCALPRPDHTPQVLELPPVARAVTHWVLPHGWCPDWGRWSQAQVPTEHATGYGPRFSAVRSALAGAYGNGRRIVQTFGASVFQVPISLGALQKVLDRVAQAIAPHYTAIATQVRHAVVHSMDETPWCRTHPLQWLWVMVSAAAALYRMHPHRSTAAFAVLIDDWAGILVSAGDGVDRHWGQARHTCLAPLIRTVRSLAERQNAARAACGAWAWAE